MVYRHRATSVQQPLQFRHCFVFITSYNEVYGFIDYPVRPRCFEASCSIVSASSQLPLYCAKSSSVARSVLEIRRQWVKSVAF